VQTGVTRPLVSGSATGSTSINKLSFGDFQQFKTMNELSYTSIKNAHNIREFVSVFFFTSGILIKPNYYIFLFGI
jgi:hypothetical protein